MSIDQTTQLGPLELQSPIVVGSCPMTTDESMRIAMCDNRVGAIVLPSVTPEELAANETCFKTMENAAATGIPVFASLRVPINNGGAVFEHAARFESSGATAIEISIQRRGICKDTDPRSIEDELVELVQQARHSIKIPIFVKLTSNFTSISHLAKRLNPSAEGLIMFGRTPVVDIQLDNIQLINEWGLTQPGSVVGTLESLMRTRTEYPDMPLIACGGIASSTDIIKAIMAGANAVMVTSAIYRNGIATLGSMSEGLQKYMNDRALENLSELQSLCPPLTEGGCERIIRNGEIGKRDFGSDSPFESQMHGDRFGHPIVETEGN